MGILENVRVQWLLRRIPDWGGQLIGWAGGLLALYNSVPAVYRPIIDQAIAGNWQSITLGGAFGFLAWGYAQVISYRSTTKPKEVAQIGGAPVEISAPRKSLVDILKGK